MRDVSLKDQFEILFDTSPYDIPLSESEYIFRAHTWIVLKMDELTIKEAYTLANLWYSEYKAKKG